MVEAPYVHDERTEATWRRPRRLPRLPALGVSGPASVADEVAYSVESARVLDLLGRALVLPDYRYSEGPALAREEAFEAWREACDAAGERVGRGGLVSVPTSGPRRPFRRVRVPRASAVAAATGREALRQKIGAFECGTDSGRLGRLRQAVGFSARVHLVDVEVPSYCAMVTLTYSDGGDWSPRHVSDYLHTLRKWWARQGFSSRLRYVWVAELQKRGAVHYHIAVFIPRGCEVPKPDDAGWWSHGMSNVKAARAAVPYLMKYLSKGNKASDHRLPGGARCYGGGGLGESMRLARRWLSLPGFIKARADVAQSDGWRRFVGGGWIDPDGVVWPSEFQRCLVGGVGCLERVLDHGRPFDVAGVFSWVK